MAEDKKRAVTVLLHNESGQILAVSRKDNELDFGLPGGKVDDGETDKEAIIRETLEETGLEIFNLRSFFVREDDNYICTTFTANYIGEISTSEKGIVKWTNFQTVKDGSFGKYNTELEEHFSKTYKYRYGDGILNPVTNESFGILSTAPNGSGYFVKAMFSNIGYAFVKKTALDNLRMHLINSVDHLDEGATTFSFEKGFQSNDFFSRVSLNPTSIACKFACTAHFDVNQYYTYTKEPRVDFLYSYHTSKVVEVGRRFKHLIPIEDWEYVEGGLWTHDCVEDARLTFNDVKKELGEKTANISFALTNSTGKTRKERADDAYYNKILIVKYGVFAKLCDRIANIEHGLLTGSSMVETYRNEQLNFLKQLHTPNDPYQEMWDYLDKLLA